MKEKLIYEKKYPRIDYVKQYVHDNKETEKHPEVKKPDVEDFYKSIYAITQYTPIPSRSDASEEFIKEAIDVSKLYQIDARIVRHEYMVSVHLSFDFDGNMMNISHLFGMADKISFFKDNSEHDFGACLDFYTHVVVRNGIAVAP